ncbi:MAG TPA: radical SAM family heme chaperone HemW [bacterium]|nr:radical SAM family heme chaperone HemW [bacterium]
MIEALYCHVPFCQTICPFCAFAVHGNRTGLHAPYLRALQAELGLAARAHGASAAPLRAVYIGGGTPSTLSLDEVAALLKALRNAFAFAADCELAVEVNPEHASPAYLEGLCALGINRVSLGLQSLDDATLRALGRGNDAAQGRRALEAVRQHGPRNWNADVLFGAPGRPSEALQADLRALSVLQPPHVSLYGLDIEPGTLFARDAQVRAWSTEHRDDQAAQYACAVEWLVGQGYGHYEVSNFCRPGFQGRQNLIVWDGGNYLGVGPGAHSHVDGRRWHNERHLRAWLRRLAAGEVPVAYEERLTPAQRANEALMLALRRDTGLDVAAWEARHGQRWDGARQALVERLVTEGRARLEAGRLVLTADGLLLADEITQALAVA